MLDIINNLEFTIKIDDECLNCVIVYDKFFIKEYGLLYNLIDLYNSRNRSFFKFNETICEWILSEKNFEKNIINYLKKHMTTKYLNILNENAFSILVYEIDLINGNKRLAIRDERELYESVI